jgi:TldD protein
MEGLGALASDLAQVALDTARARGAAYADVRVGRYRNEFVSLQFSPTSGHVPAVQARQSFGCGVRVVADGAWGFAASHRVERAEVERIAAEAVAVARANAAALREPVRLVPVDAYVDRWETPFQIDPFTVTVEAKLALLEQAVDACRAAPGVFRVTAQVWANSEHKLFASTEGSFLEQRLVRTYPFLGATAVDRQAGKSKSRNYWPGGASAGWEYAAGARLVEEAPRVGEQAVEHLRAPSVDPGPKDLVLMPSHLCLTIHESVGHSTELDRALGLEADFAGTSFLAPPREVMGRFRIGSPLVTFYGDRTDSGSLATCKYDDDGVPTQRWAIVERGTFMAYQTTRDQAHWVGEPASRGCSYADSWASIPFQRMPNIWLAPSDTPCSLDDLIAGVDDGILIDGTGSFSIDHQRYNFQFGGDAFWEIKRGRRGRMLADVAYQSRTPDFWSACDALGDARTFENPGLPGDGKGQPPQNNQISHGCPPARFRSITVLRTE